jgi:hypothetical protein
MATTLVLSKTQHELCGACLAVTYTWEDVDGYTSATAVPIFDVKAGTKVQCVGMRLNTAFDVSGTGALALSVGDDASATALLASTVIAVAAVVLVLPLLLPHRQQRQRRITAT